MTVTVRDVDIRSNDRVLKGAVVGSPDRPGDTPAIIFVHGYGSSQESYVQRAERVATELRCHCLRFDLSGHGAQRSSLSRFSVYDHLADVIAAYDHLARFDGVDSTRIGACGASYGAFLVAVLTRHREVRRMVLRAPALRSDIDDPPASGTRPDDLDSLQAISEYGGDVLVVESECDERIPRATIERHREASRRVEHFVIPGAEHALWNPVWDEIFMRRLVRWFELL